MAVLETAGIAATGATAVAAAASVGLLAGKVLPAAIGTMHVTAPAVADIAGKVAAAIGPLTENTGKFALAHGEDIFHAAEAAHTGAEVVKKTKEIIDAERKEDNDKNNNRRP